MQLNTPPSSRLAIILEETKYLFFLSYTNILEEVILGVLLTTTQASPLQCTATHSTLNVTLLLWQLQKKIRAPQVVYSS